MNEEVMKEIFNSIKNLRVGVIGDFALDIYYDSNQNTGEFSIETGKPVFYGSSIKTFLGAAGNIVNNIVSLGVKDISVFGFIGDDILGRELEYQLNKIGANTESLLTLKQPWETYAYVKPIKMKEESSRLDFGSSNKSTEQKLELIFDNLRSKISELDVLIINQQFVNPMIDSNALLRLNSIINENPNCMIFGDIRFDKSVLNKAVLKISTFDIEQLLEIDSLDERDTKTCLEKSKQVQRLLGNPILLMRGESGLMYIDENNTETVPGIYLTGDTDNLGRGNTCISAFAASMASSANIRNSLEIANLAYAIIAKKLRHTGTATAEEILELAEDCYYNYDLALAHDPRMANYFENTEIEIIGELPKKLKLKNVIFDHDGTISTLREGWEFVMHDVMILQICGDHLNDLSTEEYNRLSLRCEKFINDTTGIQTIIQMQGLREIVLEEGYIPHNEVKTPSQYKKIYLDELMISVDDRINKFNRGERSIADFTILGSVEFLKEMSKKDFDIFLASGTDEKNVIEEANALGYGNKFSGGIRGSKGNEIGDAKKIVINRIIEEGHCDGENLMVIGDGPVEIIEGRKVGAFCIGVASDEVRRHGLNLKKRTRLIRAGANIIIPDFSQLNDLLKIIFRN